VGHSLGRLVYSLPLAPCESVNLAVIDWSRTDEAQRGEDLTVREQLIHNQRRDRIIEETVTAGLAEWQRGGSVMGGLAGSYNSGALAISGAAGGAYATSSGDRNIDVSTVQRIADNISQASNSVRNLHSTVVIQSTQKERDVVQTRTVTNHNHCHAMTVLYYEVLRHYRVVTKLQTIQKGIMIKFPTIKFDMNNIENILNYRLTLEQALLDNRLSSYFDNLAKFSFVKSMLSESVPANIVPEAPVNFIFTGFQIAFTTGESGTLGDARVILLKPNGAEIILKSSEPTNTGAPEKFRHRPPKNDFQKGATDWFTVYSSDTVRWGDIRDIEIRLTSEGPFVNDWDLAHLQIYGILADERRITLFII
jgi:hypothetical protein